VTGFRLLSRRCPDGLAFLDKERARMRAMAGRILGITLLLVGVASQSPAQTTYPDIEVSGRLQEQFYFFDNDGYQTDVGPRSNIFTRRARIEAGGSISERVSFRIQPSFEGGRTSGLRLRDAYIDVRLNRSERSPTIVLRAGQEKRPFSRYELISSTNLPSIERGAGDGLPGSASNDLFEAAGFLSHDVGASLRLDHELGGDRRVRVVLGVYNGQGESLDDVNDRKSFGARATAALAPRIDVGASWFAHDDIVTDGATVDSSFTNQGWGVDAEYGKPGDQGLFALIEYLQGDDASAGKRRMRGAQGLAAYHLRTGSPTAWLYAVEPFARLDVADPDTDTDDDGATLFTAGVGLYLTAKAWLRVAYERQSFESDLAESVGGIRSMLAVSF
jgi:hypothetical protein